MKKALVLSCVLVLALAGSAMAFGVGDIAKAAKNVASAKNNDLLLGGASADLKKYEGTPYDPGKKSYKTFGDATWDALAASSSKTAMVVEFSDKVLADANAKKEDVDAAIKALEPLSAEAPKLVKSLVDFVTSVASDTSKAVMLAEAKSVKDNLTSIAEKAPKVLAALKEKATGMAGAAM
ncbi:MAG: hypothetical protein KJ042_05095 [Deltaproteobacteria bacterium]|nr:hypothetical protein [Deltaproteobacteria bacterium]